MNKVMFEYRKMINYLLLLATMIALKHFFGFELNDNIVRLIDGAMYLFGAGVIKNSVLSTTEKQVILNKSPDSIQQDQPLVTSNDPSGCFPEHEEDQ